MLNPIALSQSTLLSELIAVCDLTPLAASIVDLAQNCVRFEASPGDEDIIGLCRFGGLPDVPPGWEWPEGMIFLAQLNLEEIALHDHNHLLPQHGLLSLFHGDISQDAPLQVFWFTGNPYELERAFAPDGYSIMEENDLGGDYIVYRPIAVTPRRHISLPDWKHIADPQRQSSKDADAYLNLVKELEDEQAWAWKERLPAKHQIRAPKISSRNQLLGYPLDKDACIECCRRRLGESDDWTLLFQIDSDEYGMGTMFYDAGFLYVLIEKKDLAKADFANVYAGVYTT